MGSGKSRSKHGGRTGRRRRGRLPLNGDSLTNLVTSWTRVGLGHGTRKQLVTSGVSLFVSVLTVWDSAVGPPGTPAIPRCDSLTHETKQESSHLGPRPGLRWKLRKQTPRRGRSGTRGSPVRPTSERGRRGRPRHGRGVPGRPSHVPYLYSFRVSRNPFLFRPGDGVRQTRRPKIGVSSVNHLWLTHVDVASHSVSSSLLVLRPRDPHVQSPAPGHQHTDRYRSVPGDASRSGDRSKYRSRAEWTHRRGFLRRRGSLEGRSTKTTSVRGWSW